MRRAASPRNFQNRPSRRFRARRVGWPPTTDLLYPLTVCLVVLHACSAVSADEMDINRGGRGAGDVADSCEKLVEGARNVCEADAGKLEANGLVVANSAEREREGTAPDAEGASAVPYRTGEVAASGGACSGRRFKKCR